MKKQIRGIIALLSATIIWGSAFVSQSIGMEHVGPFTFQTARCILAVLGLIPIIAALDIRVKDGKSFLQRWLDPKLWKAGVLCGIPLFLACNLQQLGLVADTDAGKSGFLTAMYIVIVPVIGIFLKKKPSAMVPVSILLAVAGLYFLSCMGVTQISSGDLLTICCAFMFAVQIIFVDKFAPGTDALRFNTVQALTCGVLSALVMAFTETPSLPALAGCALPLAHAGFLSMGIAYSLQIVGQQDLEPTGASLIMSLEAVFAAVFGSLILHETMTGWEVLGCILVFAAVILSQIPVPTKKKVLSN